MKNTSKLLEKEDLKNNLEDEYISNLQKQIYYLELEMKLMKDKEIETKNKVGGYEILFRDGVPLNEHFLALKTKYKNEREVFENRLEEMKAEIEQYESHNVQIEEEIESTNRNYGQMSENFEKAKNFYEMKVLEWHFNQIEAKDHKRKKPDRDVDERERESAEASQQGVL